MRERATEKSLYIEPSSLGVCILLKNNALDERIHIQLTMDDMELTVRLLQERIVELKKEPGSEDDTLTGFHRNGTRFEAGDVELTD